MKLTEYPLLIVDGACGTNLQLFDIDPAEWNGSEGCNELLNLSAPHHIERLHREMLDAGAMVLETNTFGASRIVLSEYGLQEKVREVNTRAVEIARKAIAGRKGRFIAGSVGPGTKLPSLGHVDVETLKEATFEQLAALLDAGVDCLIIETCQDLLQTKTALIAAFEMLEAAGLELPVMASVTIEQQGTMLVGSDIAAVVAALKPFPLFSLGLNCATGPKDMISHVQYLSRHWPGRISVIPNQGMPEVVQGKTHYPLTPEEFAEQMWRFATQQGVSIVGGCCGTSPAHIAALSARLKDITPARREVSTKASAASLYQAVELHQEIPPLLIGERCNPNGSKAFKEALIAEDDNACLKVALDQEHRGAQVIDLCVAYAGRDELTDMMRLTRLFAGSCKTPLMFDSTSPDTLEKVLPLYPGRAIINSINLEDGGGNLDRICKLAKKYGAAVVALVIDQEGMALTASRKLAIAREIYQRAVTTHGLQPQDLLFDLLTFTVGSGDETMRRSAIETIEAIRLVRRELPGVGFTLGISNVSFGLRPTARKVLNSVFLHEAVEAGLNTAIVDAAKVLPYSAISEEDRKICFDLLYDRHPDALMAFIDYFEQATTDEDQNDTALQLRLEEQLREKVLKGDKNDLEDLLAELRGRWKPLDIVNRLLIPAMREVGDLFGRGDLLLPFVLQSAEVMKMSVALLEPYMDKLEQDGQVKVLLATVAGDVHDIGKNLVDIILTNNGYKVFNIGIKVPAEEIIAKAREYQVDVIGLSGLLVKSALLMKDNLAQFGDAGLKLPVLLGGAALTRKYVAQDCVPQYQAPVVYCADAFDGLKAIRAFESGELTSTIWSDTVVAPNRPGAQSAVIDRQWDCPSVPFIGDRQVMDIKAEILFDYLNEAALFRGRWGYRRGKMSKEAYDRLQHETVLPLYHKLKAEGLNKGWFEPKVTYGYFHCYSRENQLVVQHGGQDYPFDFPRQQSGAGLCIADFYHREEEGGDKVGFFVVTIGDKLARVTQELYAADSYHDYLMLHGLGVELTDALAEYWHEQMRIEMGIQTRNTDMEAYVAQGYQGSRYGFGYPACPDLTAHEAVFQLLHPQRIGVTLTESFEMVPEMTTSAIVAYHPQAKYFAV